MSIYCWAPVMESVSVLRRDVYARTDGWDESMGQGGEGVDLFVHVAFHSEVHFVNQRLTRTGVTVRRRRTIMPGCSVRICGCRSNGVIVAICLLDSAR